MVPFYRRYYESRDRLALQQLYALPDVLTSASAGECGFKNSRKSTPLAAQLASTKAGNKARDEYGVRSVMIVVKGFGPGRESAIRAIKDCFDVSGITDNTKVPHNGCKAEKERRV